MRTCCRRGFSFVELCIVVLILAIFAAVSLPLYLSVKAKAEKKACRLNMQTIASAVKKSKEDSSTVDFSRYIGQPLDKDHIPALELASASTCPSGGKYSSDIGSSKSASTFKVVCTVHGTYELGVDDKPDK